MRANMIALTLFSSLLLAGCAVGPMAALSRFDAQAVANGNVTLQIKPEIVSGSFSTLAAFDVNAYTRADINHLIVQLFKVTDVGTPQENAVAVKTTGGADVSKDILEGDLDAPITFSNLRSSTTYRVKAFAYNAAGTNAANLISTSDANSYVDVAVGINERPSLTTLKVKLKAKPFNGQATASGVVVTPGGLETTAPEAIN